MTPLALLAAAACVAVTGGHLTTDDLRAASPAFRGIKPGVALGYAPMPGARRIFDAAELSRIAKTNGLEGVEIPGPVCFERETAPLEEAAARAAMLEALGAPDARVEIVSLTKFPAPKGKLVFPKEWLASPPAPEAPSSWAGYVDYDGGRFTVAARVRVATRVQRVVATADLAAGHALTEADVRVETTESFPKGAAAPDRVEAVVGRVLRRRIPAGSAIPENALEAAHDVDRGQRAAVEVRGNGALLKLEAEAETSGRVGDNVRMRNLSSGKVFQARIESKGKVVVEAK
jgi:flagella basal body P-ring formation protein FlgA